AATISIFLAVAPLPLLATMPALLATMPGSWKGGAVDALAAPIYASVPLLHRFGSLAAPVALLIVAYAHFFVLIYLFGTRIGMQMYYLVVAGLTLVFIGPERVLLLAFFGALAVVLIVVLEILVPYDTGLAPPTILFLAFVVTTILTCIHLMVIVSFALREAA